MRHFFSSFIAVLGVVGLLSPAFATGFCPLCTAELDITDTTNKIGDVTRDPDTTFQSWAAGTVKLSCDDGTDWDVVDLDLEPYDLESGIDLQDADLPDVDLTSASLDCQIDVDDGLQSAVIDVDLI